MKPLILAIIATLTFSLQAFAEDLEVSPTPQQEKAITKAALQDPVVHAAIRQWQKVGATCHHSVEFVYKQYEIQMRVDCKMPDNKYFGGGSTIYTLDGTFVDGTLLLNNIKIDRAG